MTHDNHHEKSAISIPFVSVVIPSFNSGAYIRSCLDAVNGQETHLEYEVIVVDSSTDGTDRIILLNYPNVRLIHLERQCFTGMARNIGVKSARGEIVLFVDTDCIPPRDWIDKMASALTSRRTSGVCGALKNGTPWSISGSVGYYLEFFRFLPSWGRPRETMFLVGGNSGFHRTVFNQLQFLDSNIGDDVRFSSELRAMGAGLLFYPKIFVTHMNRTGFRRVMAYQRKLGAGACAYRRTMSPGITNLLSRLPILTFLLPPAVMIWIAGVVLVRRGPIGFAKFLAFLPFSLVANIAWAQGFYRALVDPDRAHDEPANVPGETRHVRNVNEV